MSSRLLSVVLLGCSFLWLPALLLSSSPGTAHAGAALRTLPLFYISRSNSKNRVHYELRVDAKCRPAGDEPIKIYWRMLEEGPNETEGLNLIERVRAYGIKIVKRTPQGVDFKFVSYKKRLARVRSQARGGKCSAAIWAPVAGAPAIVERVWVKVAPRRWWQLPKVAYVDVFGHRADGTRVNERIIPP